MKRTRDYNEEDEEIVYQGRRQGSPLATTRQIPSIQLVANPRGSPGTERVNQDLARLQQQDQIIIGLQTNPVSNVPGLSSGPGAGGYQSPQQEEEANIRMFAIDIASSWSNYQDEFQAIMREFEQRAAVAQVSQREERERQAEHNRAAIFQGLSRGASGLLLSMIVLSIFTNDSANDSANDRLIQVIFFSSPTLARLFQLLSKYVVRPFVMRNMANIQNIPNIMNQGYSSNQLSAILSMIFTGMSAYGVSELVGHVGIDPVVVVSNGIDVIAQTIRSAFPIVSQCVTEAGNVALRSALRCGANLTNQVLSYMENTFLRNPLMTPASSSSQSSQYSLNSLNSLNSLSTADPREIGSVVLSILDGDQSVTDSVREIFENLAQGQDFNPSSSTVSSLSASQPFLGGLLRTRGRRSKRMKMKKSRSKSKSKLQKKYKRQKRTVKRSAFRKRF